MKATEKQIAFLKNKGIDATYMSKQDASAKISEIIENRNAVKTETIKAPQETEGSDNTRQNSIERQCALKTAVSWCNAQEEKMDVLTAADAFVKWIKKS